MEVDIYKAIGSKIDQRNWFIIIEYKKNLEKTVSKELLSKADKFNFFKTITIHEGEHRIALDSTEAIRDISTKGFHLQGVKIDIH